MTHKKKLFLTMILLLATSLPAMAQNSAGPYHDLKGMVDTAEVVHLFFGHHTGQYNEILQYNTSTGKLSRFLKGQNKTLSNPSITIGDNYAFFNRDPDNYIYSKITIVVDPVGGIERCDSACVSTYRAYPTIFEPIGVADSSSRVYVNIGSYYTYRATMISTDEGYHWKGVSFSTGQLYPPPDSVIPAAFISVAPYNEDLAFFDSTSNGLTYLEQTRTGGDSLSIVDTTIGSWLFDETQGYYSSFHYDPDTTHVYAIITQVPQSGKTWYELRGSGKQGDAGSWQTLYQDTTRFYVSLDQDQSGVLFLAEGRKIYKFGNYGGDINLNQVPWQTLPDTSCTIIGIYKHPGEDIVYALTDSSLLKVTPSGIHTLSRITTGIEQPGSNQEPDQYVLHQNYPNPFNPTTTIRYEVAKAGPVRLTVYNILGQRVSVLVNTRQPAGSHQVTFNASQLASGLYFYRLQAGNKVFVKKMLVME